jgi:DNA replication protein DnaC
MSPTQLERLAEHLTKLRLFKSRERLEALLQQAAGEELAYADFLEQVLAEEVATKTSKNVAMRTAMARFPFVKPLETFDKVGYRVLFTTAATLIATLTKAQTEGRLAEKLKVFTTPRLLIINEIGYLPIERPGANLFFQLISRRYERGPMILTSNQSFGAWGEVFGDRVIATAILDRLLHHAVTLNIRGNAYRLKEKLKAGLVRPEETPA